jgi:hypothetical protein
MVNEGTAGDIQDDAGKALRTLLRHLARRNLCAATCSASRPARRWPPRWASRRSPKEELRRGNTPEVNAALEEGGFLQHTPLWYYVLKEAEVRADGNALGELGSRIVCETVIGLLKHDRNSTSTTAAGGGRRRTPVRLPNGDPIVTIRDFLRFAGVMA